MKPEIKKKWVKALRSGAYAKGKMELCTPGREFDRFCVLGVLCDLYCRETGEGWELDTDDAGDPVYRLLGCSSDLPLEVARWAGFNAGVDDEVYFNEVRYSITMLNDTGVNGGLSFKGLASLIEAQL